MDAAEWAHGLLSELPLEYLVPDDEETVASVIAEQIRQAEQAARQDERRKVLEEAARLVEVKGEEERLLGDKFAADWRAVKPKKMVEFATEEDREKAHLGLMKEKQYEIAYFSRELGVAIRALAEEVT